MCVQAALSDNDGCVRLLRMLGVVGRPCFGGALSWVLVAMPFLYAAAQGCMHLVFTSARLGCCPGIGCTSICCRCARF